MVLGDRVAHDRDILLEEVEAVIFSVMSDVGCRWVKVPGTGEIVLIQGHRLIVIEDAVFQEFDRLLILSLNHQMASNVIRRVISMVFEKLAYRRWKRQFAKTPDSFRFSPSPLA